jgi:hypothetical protein
MSTFDEQQLRFVFPDHWDAERFDDPGKPSINFFKPVDFVVELSERTLFIEVKDPSNTNAPQANRDDFLRQMRTKTLIHDHLVPKARTSWAFLRLMKRAEKPITYIVVIGADSLRIEPLLWSNFTATWPLQYVDQCIVIPTSDLSRHLPGVTVQRLAATP